MSLDNYNKFCWQDGDLHITSPNYRHFVWTDNELIITKPKGFKVTSDEFKKDLNHLEDWHKKVIDNPNHAKIKKDNLARRPYIPEHQRNSVYKYMHYSKDLNSALRGKENLGHYKKRITNLDKVLDNPLKYNTVVYRGLSENQAKDLHDGLDAHDFGYTSTSLNPDEAKITAETNKVARIFIKKGSKGAYLPHARNDKTLRDSEEEFLLPKHSKFKVLGRHEDRGMNYIDLELHSPKPKKKPVKSNLQSKIDYLKSK